MVSGQVGFCQMAQLRKVLDVVGTGEVKTRIHKLKGQGCTVSEFAANANYFFVCFNLKILLDMEEIRSPCCFHSTLREPLSNTEL